MSSILLTMIIILIVLGILQSNIKFAEWWSRNVTRQYTSAFGVATENLQFSAMEVSFFVSIVSCIVFLAWGFCCLGNKQIWPFIHKVMMVVLVITGTITVYSATVGVAYYRAPVPFEKYNGDIDSTQFKEIATYFVEDYNYCGEKLGFDENGELKMPYSRDTLVYKLRDEFKRLPDNGYFGSYVPKAKEMLSTGIFTAFGIVGVYFGPLGESNFSTYATNAEMPFYIMHELAHGVGAMREDDAQLVATYLCLSSEDPYIRYSCYLNTIDSIINITRYTDNPSDFADTWNLISDGIRGNYSFIYDHWEGKTFIADLGNKINDLYLKLFGQKSGTGSYDDTPTGTDDSGKVITLSNYQNIYFNRYYQSKI